MTRLVSAPVFFVLACACAEAPSHPAAPATQFVVSDLWILPPGEGLDLDADGDVDNGVGLLGASEQGLNSLLRSAVQDGTFLLLLELSGVDSPEEDPAIGVVFYRGVDTDGEPGGHLDGSAALSIDPGSFDADGNPLLTGSGAIAAGVIDASLSRFELLGLFELVQVRLVADGAGRLRELSGILGGAMPVTALAAIDAGGGATGLDLLVVNYELSPDLDRDADGLETFSDSDGDGRVDRCVDGDGTTTVEGASCPDDPRFADAFSMDFGLDAVPCRILGTGGPS